VGVARETEREAHAAAYDDKKERENL